MCGVNRAPFGPSSHRLEEHRELEWPFFDWMVETDRHGYVLPQRPERLPLMYTLEAIKEACPCER